jgi:hypothetical protein
VVAIGAACGALRRYAGWPAGGWAAGASKALQANDGLVKRIPFFAQFSQYFFQVHAYHSFQKTQARWRQVRRRWIDP